MHLLTYRVTLKKQQRKVNVKAVISLGCGDVTQPLSIDKPDKANL